MTTQSLRGQDILAGVLGKKIGGIHRWVLDLGGANDEFGHGISQFEANGNCLVIRPGPNEDFMLVEQGPFNAEQLDPEYWTEVSFANLPGWREPNGAIAQIDLFTDGLEDVGLVFRFEGGESVVFALVDSDLVVGENLSMFDEDPNMVRPRLRETIVNT